jgi:hypothetical protein
MSASERFLLEYSLSSDEYDIEDMILDDDVEKTMVVITVKELIDRMSMKAVAQIDPRPYLHPMEPRPRPCQFDARLLRRGTHIPTIPIS